MLYKLAETKARVSHKDSKNFIYFVFTLGLLAILFQVGHFFEHIIQVSAWIGGYKEKPYMTEFGVFLVNSLGGLFFPHETDMRKNMLGMDVLHLIGNTIFVAGIATMYYFLRVKAMLFALIIQTFHFYEHISLTSSNIIIGKSIGLSTLYGMSLDQYVLTAYRVWWHFLFNAIPTALVLFSLYVYYRTQKK